MDGHAAPLAGTVCGSGMQSKTVNGRRPAIVSLVCAALALAVAPVVFGPLGVIAGMVAVWKGDGWWENGRRLPERRGGGGWVRVGSGA